MDKMEIKYEIAQLTALLAALCGNDIEKAIEMIQSRLYAHRHILLHMKENKNDVNS